MLRPEVSSIYWVILGWLSSLGWTVISSALCWYSQPMSITSRLMVAENMERDLRAFIISMICRTSL